MSGGIVSAALMLLLGLITGGLVCLARLDDAQLETHLEYSWGIGRLFAIGAFFCLFLDPHTQRSALSMCAGGAAGSFAYHAACRLASYFQR
jgi:hypothetical protein